MKERYAALGVMWLALAAMLVGLGITLGPVHAATVLVLGLVGMPVVGLLSLGLIVHRHADEDGTHG